MENTTNRCIAGLLLGYSCIVLYQAEVWRGTLEEQDIYSCWRSNH